MSFKFTGQAEVVRELRRLGKRAPEELGGALFRFAETEIIGPAKETYVPIRFGLLKASGFVELPEVSGSQVSITFGFGGAAASYAAIVHESHPTKSKFLQIPLFASLPTAASKIASDLRSKL